MTILLTGEQQRAVDCEGNVLVTACPGSGKTRVLTARVARAVTELASHRSRVAAITYTHRAADEISERLRRAGVDVESVWTGTIHAFALEWVLRPYGQYCVRLRRGFHVVDDYYTRRLLERLKSEEGLKRYADVHTRWTREGDLAQPPKTHAAERVVESYHEHLREHKALDFDLVLYFAYRLCLENPEVPTTLARLFSVVCVDEYQDTQDLQYELLAQLARSKGRTKFFFVGDPDQAIYWSLGGVARSHQDLEASFGASFTHVGLTGNFRSTQRVVDFCHHFRVSQTTSVSRAAWALDRGRIKFENQTIDRSCIPNYVAERIRESVADGVPPSEICVVAPQWSMLTSLARELARILPDVALNAPGLSPLPRNGHGLWYELARLFLTVPGPDTLVRRRRWAARLSTELQHYTGMALPHPDAPARTLLRVQNSITSEHGQLGPFLQDVLPRCLNALGVDLARHRQLSESLSAFLAQVADNVERKLPSDVEGLRRTFTRPDGVTVGTCHGVKGEEYEVVIAFGLLHGFVPHWGAIFDDGVDDAREAQRLLYVVASRAKRQLFLVSESGRATRRRVPLETTRPLVCPGFAYDP